MEMPPSVTGVTALMVKLARGVVYRTMLLMSASLPAVNP